MAGQRLFTPASDQEADAAPTSLAIAERMELAKPKPARPSRLEDWQP